MGQIGDIMEKNVITIEKDQTAQEAAEIIAEKDISFLVVMKDGMPEGVLSESDFVRKVTANNKKSAELKVLKICDDLRIYNPLVSNVIVNVRKS